MNNTDCKKWTFFEYAQGETRRDSGSEKNFRDLDIHASLIRELIQNSLDAVSDSSKPVEIKIRFTESGKNDCARYFQDLEPHYKASFGQALKIAEKVRFLVLEDFNTTGLKGERQDDFFLKDNIRTGSGRSSGGSHGIGKIVFYRASRINTFVAFSVYDNGSVFKACCDFKTHEIAGTAFKEDGRLALCPENDAGFMQTLFVRTREQKGLSIAIPLPDAELSTKGLEQAITNEYYYPLINGKLVVALEDTKEAIKIDSNYILEQKTAKRELISHYRTLPPEKLLRIPIGDAYTGKDEPLNPQQKQDIISRLENDEEGVIIRFALSVKLKSRQREEGYLDLALSRKKDEKDKDSHFDFWRENLLIKDAAGRNKGSSDYNAIVLIHGQDNALSHLLRELENPSHTRWEYRNPNDEVKNKYRNILQLVPFITQLPSKVIRSVMQAGITLDSNFFSDFFPDTSAASGTSNQGQPSGNTDDKTPADIKANSNFYYRENRKNNGFILSLSDTGKRNDFAKISITIAYGTNRGNPFKNYDTRDFDLRENIKIDLKGGRQIEKQANHLLCHIKDKDDFKVTLSGFDPDRKLKIDAKEEAES